MERRPLGQMGASGHEERGGRDKQGIGPFSPNAFERRVDFIAGIGFEDLDL